MALIPFHQRALIVLAINKARMIKNIASIGGLVIGSGLRGVKIPLP